MYCKKCGKEISDDSKFCNSCGANLFIDTSVITNDVQKETVKKKKKKNKKKDSTLSVVAVVLCLFTITFLPGIICALIDLTLNDKEKSHGYSWLALVLGVLAAILIFQ